MFRKSFSNFWNLFIIWFLSFYVDLVSCFIIFPEFDSWKFSSSCSYSIWIGFRFLSPLVWWLAPASSSSSSVVAAEIGRRILIAVEFIYNIIRWEQNGLKHIKMQWKTRHDQRMYLQQIDEYLQRLFYDVDTFLSCKRE